MTQFSVAQIIENIRQAQKELVATNIFIDEAQELSEYIEHIKQPLLIMVMGEFSTGKSTFINALVGKQIAVVDALPTTAVITKLGYGDAERVIVYYRDGSNHEYAPDEWGRLTAESDDEANALHEKIDYVERSVPISVLKDMSVIDSPGLNALKEAHEEATKRFVEQADTVLWMISSEKAATDTEYQGIEKLSPRLKPIVIVNKMDLLDEEEGDDPETFLQNIRGKLKDKVQAVIGISAEFAFQGKTENNEELLIDSNFSAFDNIVRDVILPNRDAYKVNSLIDELNEWFYGAMLRVRAAEGENKQNEERDYNKYVENRSILSRVEDALALIAQPLKDYCQESTNNASAIAFLGILHEFGLVLVQQEAQALSAYEKAAVKNNAFAQYLLGKHFLDDHENEKAAYWIKRSAELGCMNAKVEMAKLYFSGVGIDQDIKLAKELFESVGEHKDEICWGLLGDIYKSEKEYAKSIIAYTRAANGNNASAQFNLGMYYLKGIEFDKNENEAVEWLQRAASQNHPEAQYYLGIKLLESSDENKRSAGLSYIKNAANQGNVTAIQFLGNKSLNDKLFDEAVNYFSAGAKINDPESKYRLSMIYRTQGYGSVEQAQELLWDAAQQNYISAVGQLAIDIYTGENEEKNDKLAYDFAKKAALNDDSNAQYVLAAMSLDGKISDYSEFDAIQAMEKLAKSGMNKSNEYLGNYYLNKGKDYVKAKYWLEQAQNNPNTDYMLGCMYFEGKGVSTDAKIAENYFEKAKNNGNVSAMVKLAEMYLTPERVGTNGLEAISLYEKAAQNGVSLAQFRLGYFYQTGLIVDQDYEKAREWYDKASIAGNSMAQNNLAMLLEAGLGGAKDFKRAYDLCCEAAKAGVSNAKKTMIYMCYTGIGTAQNPMKARELYDNLTEVEKTTDDDYLNKIMGDMYMYGITLAEDRKTAKDFYERLLKKDNYTLCNLAKIYYDEDKLGNQTKVLQLLETPINEKNTTAISMITKICHESSYRYCTKCKKLVKPKNSFGCGTIFVVIGLAILTSGIAMVVFIILYILGSFEKHCPDCGESDFADEKK